MHPSFFMMVTCIHAEVANCLLSHSAENRGADRGKPGVGPPPNSTPGNENGDLGHRAQGCLPGIP